MRIIQILLFLMLFLPIYVITAAHEDQNDQKHKKFPRPRLMSAFNLAKIGEGGQLVAESPRSRSLSSGIDNIPSQTRKKPQKKSETQIIEQKLKKVCDSLKKDPGNKLNHPLKIELGSNKHISHVPIIWATKYNILPMAQALLEYMPNLQLKDDMNGRTPLMYAAFNGMYQIIKNMLEQATDTLDWTDSEAHTALMLAAMQGHAHAVNELLPFKPDGFLVDRLGNSALIYAIKRGLYDCFSALMDIDDKDDEYIGNMPNKKGQTPLICAMLSHQECGVSLDDQEKTVRTLLEFGKGKLDISLADVKGHTALTYATSIGPEILSYCILTEGSGDLGKTAHVNLSRTTPLMFACLHDFSCTAEELMKDMQYKDIIARDKAGATALHYAAALYSYPERYPDNGAKVSLKGPEVTTQTLEMLINRIKLSPSKVDDINARTKEHQLTPLMLAARDGWVEGVAVLLDSDVCDVNLRHTHGWSACNFAWHGMQHEIYLGRSGGDHQSVMALLGQHLVADFN